MATPLLKTLQWSQLTLGENQHPYNGLQGPPTLAHLVSYQQLPDLIIPITPGSYPPATGLLDGPQEMDLPGMLCPLGC